MHKKPIHSLFLFSILVLLLIPFMSPIVLPLFISDLDSSQEMMNSPFSPTLVSASEEEEVDNFGAVPNYRWHDIRAKNGTTESVENGYEVITTANSTTDLSIYEKYRPLNTRDFYAESRFLLQKNTTELDFAELAFQDEWDFDEGDFDTFPSNSSVGYWKFDENQGTQANDSSGRDHHSIGGTWPEWVSGVYGSALDFDKPNSEFIRIADHNDFSLIEGEGNDAPFSITFWMRPTQKNVRLLGKWDTTDPNTGQEYMVAISGGDQLQISLRNHDDSSMIYVATGSIVSYYNAFTHVTFTCDGSGSDEGLFVYLNGTDASVLRSESGVYDGMGNTGENLIIGATDDGTDYFFDGILDDVRFYKGVELSAGAIQAIMSNVYTAEGLIASVHSSGYHQLDLSQNATIHDNIPMRCIDLAPLNIPTYIYTTLNFSIYSNDNFSIKILAIALNNSYYALGDYLDYSSGWNNLIIDLTNVSGYLSESHWATIGIYLYDEDLDIFDADELFYLDFFSIQGEQGSNGFKFAWLDNDLAELFYLRFIPLNSSYCHLDIDLLDISESIYLSYDYDFAYDYIDGEWLRLDFEVDMDEIELDLELSFEGGSDIVDDNLYDIFGSLPRHMPALFTTSDFPQMALINTQGCFNSSTVIISFIDSNWKIMDWWTQEGMSGNNGGFDSAVILVGNHDPDSFQGVSPYGFIYEGIPPTTNNYWAWYRLDIDKFDGVTFKVDVSLADYESTMDYSLFVAQLRAVLPNGTLRTVLNMKAQASVNSEYVELAYFNETGIEVGKVVAQDTTDRDFSASFSVYLDSGENTIIGQCTNDNGGKAELSCSTKWENNILPREYLLLFGYLFKDCDRSDNDLFSVRMSQLEITRKDILQEVAGFILNPILEFLAPIFAPLILLLQALMIVFREVGKMIVGGLSVVIEALEVALEQAIGALEPLLGAIEGAVNGLIGYIQSIGDYVATALSTILGQILDAIVDVAAEIWATLEPVIEDVIGWIIAVLLTIISSLVDVFTKIAFFLWDAIGFPDVLAIIAQWLPVFVEFIFGVPPFVIDLFNVIFFWGSWLLVLGLAYIVIGAALKAQAEGTGGLGWITNMIEYAGKDLFGGNLSIATVQIPCPIGIVIVPLVTIIILGVW